MTEASPKLPLLTWRGLAFHEGVSGVLRAGRFSVTLCGTTTNEALWHHGRVRVPGYHPDPMGALEQLLRSLRAWASPAGGETVGFMAADLASLSERDHTAEEQLGHQQAIALKKDLTHFFAVAREAHGMVLQDGRRPHLARVAQQAFDTNRLSVILSRAARFIHYGDTWGRHIPWSEVSHFLWRTEGISALEATCFALIEADRARFVYLGYGPTGCDCPDCEKMNGKPTH